MLEGDDAMLGEIEALYATRLPAFLRVARAILGDRERALEAVQDGFADAIRSRGSFRREGPLEAWVWRTVVNAARKAARRPLVEETLSFVETDERPSPPTGVGRVVRSLPERQRLVLFLRYYADLDYRSIADALGVEVGTVSSSLAAARAAVRKALVEVNGL
jgi:RNA polymerase sigma-70 factor (ECF subfamily)